MTLNALYSLIILKNHEVRDTKVKLENVVWKNNDQWFRIAANQVKIAILVANIRFN